MQTLANILAGVGGDPYATTPGLAPLIMQQQMAQGMMPQNAPTGVQPNLLPPGMMPPPQMPGQPQSGGLGSMAQAALPMMAGAYG